MFIIKTAQVKRLKEAHQHVVDVLKGKK